MKQLFYEVNSLDKRCYDEYELSEDLLMENASIGLTKEIKKRVKEEKK